MHTSRQFPATLSAIEAEHGRTILALVYSACLVAIRRQS